MTKPHKFEVNSTKSRSLTHFEFLLDNKWSMSINKILFKSVFQRGFQKFYSLFVWMSSYFEQYRCSSCKNIFKKKAFPSLFDLNRSLNSKFNLIFEILAKKTLLKSILFIDIDHLLSKRNSKCVSDLDLVEFTSNLCGFVIAFLCNFFLCVFRFLSRLESRTINSNQRKLL